MLAANDVGFEDIYLLKGGLKEFRKNILNFQKPDGPISPHMHDTYRFRELASKQLPIIIEEAKPKIIEKNVSKRVLGGC